MKRRFFQQNVWLLLVPVIIPVIILGGLVSYISTHYIRTEIDYRNLYQIQNISRSIDSVMEDLEKINISLSNNPAVLMQLKRVISYRSNGIMAEDYNAFNAIISLLYASSGVSENVHSLYIYFNNDNSQFISNTNKISRLDFFPDVSWYEEYEKHMLSPEKVWSELREINSSASLPPTSVLTIYRKIYASGKSKPDGVLVLNVKRDSINKALDNLYHDEKQVVFIADVSANSVVFQNKDFSAIVPGLTDEIRKQILEDPRDTFSMKIGNETYVVNHTPASFYDWQYVSIIPAGILYGILHLLTKIIVLMALLTASISLGLSYYNANKNYNDIKSIIHIIDSAINGHKLPELPPVAYDIYRYILHNVLKTFLENEYLHVQLSEKHYHVKTLELLALQAQLNPHFLFNTMETLYWKAIAVTGGENEITTTIDNLSDLLRYALDSEDDKVSLHKEIAITKSYLEIQSMRYQDLFDVIWDYPFFMQSIPVAKLLLQPLVENSIYHGIRPKHGEKSIIKICVRLTKKNLMMYVADTGVGMTKQELFNLRLLLEKDHSEQTKHIGLCNTHKRIRLMYGDDYGLRIFSKKNCGTTVHIVLPLPEEQFADPVLPTVCTEISGTVHSRSTPKQTQTFGLPTAFGSVEATPFAFSEKLDG